MNLSSLSNAIVALIFSASGPVAVILTVGQGGGLTASQLASWLFGIFVVAGIITVVATVIYRRPLAFAWTIPGTVLLGGPVLASGGRYTWAEVVGTFYATGILILILSLTGMVRKVMDLIPMPIVMAMVAGVFLKFGTDLVQSVRTDAVLAGGMVLVFLLLTRITRLGKYLPPGDRRAAGRRGDHCRNRKVRPAVDPTRLVLRPARVHRPAVVAAGHDRTGHPDDHHRAGGAERPGGDGHSPEGRVRAAGQHRRDAERSGHPGRGHRRGPSVLPDRGRPTRS